MEMLWKQYAMLKEVVLEDADVLEIMVSPKIKKLVVEKCPKNFVKGFEKL